MTFTKPLLHENTKHSPITKEKSEEIVQPLVQ